MHMHSKTTVQASFRVGHPLPFDRFSTTTNFKETSSLKIFIILITFSTLTQTVNMPSSTRHMSLECVCVLGQQVI